MHMYNYVNWFNYGILSKNILRMRNRGDNKNFIKGFCMMKAKPTNFHIIPFHKNFSIKILKQITQNTCGYFRLFFFKF